MSRLNPAGGGVVGGRDQIRDIYGSLEAWKRGSIERGALTFDLCLWSVTIDHLNGKWFAANASPRRILPVVSCRWWSVVVVGGGVDQIRDKY